MGIPVLHYDMRFLKPIDESALDDAIAKCSNIITVEDGTILGGLHSAVCEYVATGSYNVKVTAMGVPDRFIEQGSVPELQQECNFDEESILKTIINVSKRTS